MSNLSDIAGIGENSLARLQAAGVLCQQELLEQASTLAGRTELIRATGISDTLILQWADHADLAQIQGVRSDYTDLLQCAGVKNVTQLAQSNGRKLHARMLELNAEKNLVSSPPLESMVYRWVARAKGAGF